jgi:hypothetical protein
MIVYCIMYVTYLSIMYDCIYCIMYVTYLSIMYDCILYNVCYVCYVFKYNVCYVFKYNV